MNNFNAMRFLLPNLHNSFWRLKFGYQRKVFFYIINQIYCIHKIPLS